MISYLNKINEFVNSLDTESGRALNAISVNKTYKKGAFLLQQDQICRKSFFIEKGVGRKYYLNDGKEITTELLFENDIAISLDSYTLQKPSREIIQAVTDINVAETDYQQFQKAKINFPKLVTLDLMMTEYYAIWLENRLFQFHTLSATERDKLLLKEHPHYIQNVPLTFIASYIGISFFMFVGSKVSENKFAQDISKTGQMTLTHYISHLTIGMIFFAILTGKTYVAKINEQEPTNPFYIFCFALFYFIVSFYFSEFWTRKFKNGPFETLMRRISG